MIPVIARRPIGPTWQSVMLDEETDSHVASLLGMTSLYYMRDRFIRPQNFLPFLKKPLYKAGALCYYLNTNKSYY